MLLVERQLTHTVDGVVNGLAYFCHTVLGALQHHARTKHTAEVGTLDGVQQTTGIDRTEAVRLEAGLHLIGDGLVAQELQILFLRQTLVLLIEHTVDGDISQTPVFQLEVGTLTVRETAILIDTDGLLQAVVVGAVVGDVQLTIAVYHTQVTTTIETTGMLGSDSDEITVVDIIECRGGIAVDGRGIGVGLFTVRGHVSTGKHGIADIDTALFLTGGVACEEFLPVGTGIGTAVILLRQGIQIVRRHIVKRMICLTIVSDGVAVLDLQIGGNDHLTVFGQFTVSTIIIDMTGRTCSYLLLGLVTIDTGAVDVADIATTEDVAITFGHTFAGTNLTTMDMNLGLTEDVTVHVKGSLLTIAEDIVSLTTTVDIAQHMTVVDLYVGLTGLVDAFQRTDGVRRTAGLNSSTADGSYLTATHNAVADCAVPHGNIAEVNTTQHIIAATKQVTAVFQTTGTAPDIIRPIGLVINFLYVSLGSSCRGNNLTLFVQGLTGLQVDIAYITVIQGQVGRTIDGTALTTTVGVTLDGGHTIVEAVV